MIEERTIEQRLQDLAIVMEQQLRGDVAQTALDALEVILDLKSELEHINYQGDLKEVYPSFKSTTSVNK